MPDKYFIKRTGFINASGNDLIDFINRMSTNDLRKFPENEYRKTVLTTDKGRIIDLINIFNLIENKFILTSDIYQEKVKSHLDKFIIMDDVALGIPESKYFHIVISGDVFSISEKLFGIKSELNKIYKLNENGFLYQDEFKINTINIVCKEESITGYRELLKDMTEQTCQEYEFNRIEAGIPEGENEFNDNVNPMECGLEKYISFNKGCYIGQEVIARLDSQGKLPKRMIRIDSEQAFRRNDKIFLTEDNKEAGFVSSAVTYDKKNTGLGFIRSVNLDIEKEYFLEGSDPENKVKINVSNIN
ncbi:MAG TPA: hypothetical protein PKA90_11805 [Ignavibacteria bacterium]|nr:hypothetical protein [Ignavibacteria bacterium]HMR41104.1 hypothetical protein [Ignavibacteria bacterium]